GCWATTVMPAAHTAATIKTALSSLMVLSFREPHAKQARTHDPRAGGASHRNARPSTSASASPRRRSAGHGAKLNYYARHPLGLEKWKVEKRADSTCLLPAVHCVRGCPAILSMTRSTTRSQRGR